MSEPVIGEKGPFGIPLHQLQERFDQFVKSRQRSMLGVSEIAGLVITGILLTITLCGYFLYLLPARKELTDSQLERNRLNTQKRELEKNFEEHQGVKANVDKILESLQSFETKLLTPKNEGRIAVIEELNEMIARNELRSNGGATYSPLEPLQLDTENKGRPMSQTSRQSKWLSVFPGIGIDLTVDGPYRRLRQFVKEIEDNKWFLVINSIELEGSDNPSLMAAQSASAEGGQPTGEASVSLRLNLTSYFRRDSTGGSILNSNNADKAKKESEEEGSNNLNSNKEGLDKKKSEEPMPSNQKPKTKKDGSIES
jgi:hypothetical protein